MPSSTVIYPAQIDNTTTLPSAVDGLVISADLINTLRAAILAIESTLGINPATVYGTVRARLDSLENAINNQETISLTGDLGGTLSNPLVVGIQGIPILSAQPTAGEALIFNGSFWAPTPISNNSYLITLSGPPIFVEIGQVVMNPLFFATYSNTPSTATFQDNVGGPVLNVLTAPSPSNPPDMFIYNGQSYLSNAYTNPPYSVIFTLSSNNGTINSTAELTITWGQNIYYGLGSSGQSSSTFIKSLNEVGAISKSTTFTVDAGASEYIYFAYRSAYGTANFWVDGWEGGFNLISNSISLTNHSGFTENYTLYQSTNSGLGNTTVNVL